MRLEAVFVSLEARGEQGAKEYSTKEEALAQDLAFQPIAKIGESQSDAKHDWNGKDYL